MSRRKTESGNFAERHGQNLKRRLHHIIASQYVCMIVCITSIIEACHCKL